MSRLHVLIALSVCLLAAGGCASESRPTANPTTPRVPAALPATQTISVESSRVIATLQIPRQLRVGERNPAVLTVTNMSSATVGVGGRDVVLTDAAGATAFDWFNAAGLSGHRGYMPFMRKLAPGASTTQVLWFVVPSPGDYAISIPPWPGVSDLGLTAKGSIRVR